MKGKRIDRTSPAGITSKRSASSLAPALSLLQALLATSEEYANESSGVSKSGGTHTHVYTLPFLSEELTNKVHQTYTLLAHIEH